MSSSGTIVGGSDKLKWNEIVFRPFGDDGMGGALASALTLTNEKY